MGLPVADLDDDVGPLRAHWRIWLFPGHDRVPEHPVAAGRHDELLALIAKSEYQHKSWHYRVWGRQGPGCGRQARRVHPLRSGLERTKRATDGNAVDLSD
jgi:hypothetical protein